MNDTTTMNDTSLNCGMDAPGARILPRTGSLLLYTLTAANARVAMAESTFGRGLSGGDVQPLLVTHVDTFGEVVHLVGVVITARGVNLPVDGVPLVREPSPGAAHWPDLDDSLVATLEERAAARSLGLPEEVAALPSDTGLLRDELLTARRNAEFYRLALESKAEHETHLIKWRDDAIKEMGWMSDIGKRVLAQRDEAVTERDEARAEVLRWQADSRRKLAERDEARAALAALQGVGADADELRVMHAKAEAALREAVDERDALRAHCDSLVARLNQAMNMINSARESLGSVGV